MALHYAQLYKNSHFMLNKGMLPAVIVWLRVLEYRSQHLYKQHMPWQAFFFLAVHQSNQPKQNLLCYWSSHVSHYPLSFLLRNELDIWFDTTSNLADWKVLACDLQIKIIYVSIQPSRDLWEIHQSKTKMPIRCFSMRISHFHALKPYYDTKSHNNGKSLMRSD